jgi:glycosidase
MPWTAGPNAGFSAAPPWLPLASDHPALTVERQIADPDSVLHLVRDLLRLRRERPALAVGSYRPLAAPEGVLSFERRHPDGSLEVHLNLGDRAVAIEPSARGRVLVSTDRRRDGAPVHERLELGPFEGVVAAPD